MTTQLVKDALGGVEITYDELSKQLTDQEIEVFAHESYKKSIIAAYKKSPEMVALVEALEQARVFVGNTGYEDSKTWIMINKALAPFMEPA